MTSLPLDLSRQTYPRSAAFPSNQIYSGSGFPRNYPSLDGKPLVSPLSSLNTNGYGMDDVGYDTITGRRRVTGFTGTKQELQSSLDYGTLMFGMVLPKTIARYTAAASAGTAMHDMPIVGKSISALNLYLKSETGRRKYGGMTDAAQLVDDWQLQGAQMTDFTPDTKMSGEMAITVGVDGRARLPDIFQVGGCRSARVNDTCYLIWERQTLSSNAMDEAPDSKVVLDAPPMSYWEIIPLLMPGKTPVPVEWYTGYNAKAGKWIFGHCRYLGLLTDVFRTGGDAGRLNKLAKEAVFPTSSNVDAGRKAMMELGAVELQMKMK